MEVVAKRYTYDGAVTLQLDMIAHVNERIHGGKIAIYVQGVKSRWWKICMNCLLHCNSCDQYEDD